MYAGSSSCGRGRRSCLPCRRSRVRIPSAASEKACVCRSFHSSSRLVRLLCAGPKPDPRQTGAYVRLEECGRLQGSWLVELLTSCEDDAEGHEFDPSGGPVSVRNRALARAGPTDLQDDRLAPRAGACRRSAQEPLTPPRRQSRDPFREPQATLGGFGRSQPRGRALGSRSRRFRHPHG